MRTRHKILLCLIPLYVITGIGGYYSHSATLRRETQSIYDRAKERDHVDADIAAKMGIKPRQPRVFETGPTDLKPLCKVNWCVPVLPGVLFANSYYQVGPLFGKGGFKIVIYYGFGSWAIGPIWGWIS